MSAGKIYEERITLQIENDLNFNIITILDL